VCPDTCRDFGSECSGVAAYKNLLAGWRFVLKTLDKDLTFIPPADKSYVAHAMADWFDDVYEGCGYNAACYYIPWLSTLES
jgi:hypothetical protein